MCAILLGFVLALSAATVRAGGPDAQGRISFDIPRQSADRALIDFAEQADVTFMFPFEVSRNRIANRLVGMYSREEAIAILLRGTGLHAEFSSDGVLTVSSKPPPGGVNKNDEVDSTMMTRSTPKTSFVARFSAALAAVFSAVTQAQGQEGTPQQAAELEEIIVTGTRRLDRTVAESLSPIDVYSTEDLSRQGSGDMLQVLRNLNPTFNVRYFPSANGSSFVRPPTLRNLPPDKVLVLINGKRRHRSALLQENAGALSGGSQGPDIAQIPSIAVERVEVLKDGASAQYGSDAIAGVINFRLKERSNGVAAAAKYGQFYQGDGVETQFETSIGLPLGEAGFLNVSADYLKSDETSRGVTRPAALALANTFPSLRVANPAQLFGNPNTEGLKFFVNSAFDLTDHSRLYFFGNYGETESNNGFNYRLSQTVTGPTPDGTGTMTFGRNSVFNPIYTTLTASGQGVITGSTFNFAEIFPAGFTPRFYGDISDASTVAGYKGETASNLTYDFSASYGMSRVEFSMNDSVNPSMGPLSPTRFYIGSLEQRESGLNADFTYPLNLGLAQPFTLAAGAEFRTETYLIGAGDPASYQAGPYARVPLVNADGTPVMSGGSQAIAIQPVGSNGFSGFSPKDVVDDSRHSSAAYVALEGDITEALSVGIAGRYEDFSDFGDSLTGKLSARYELSDAVSVRATASTGFHAPATAQLYTRYTTTLFSPTSTTPVEIQVLPSTSAAAVYFGGQPLEPETAVNYSAGIVLTPLPQFTAALDFYQIDVTDRIGYSQSFQVTDADRPALQAAGVPDYATIGLVRYFTNSFDTRVRGVDLVASHLLATSGAGNFETTLSVSYNETEVTKRDPAIISLGTVNGIENINPNVRAVLSETWSNDRLSALLRVRYYGSYADTESSGVLTPFGSDVTADLEVSYKIGAAWTVSIGGENIFDTYPEKIPGAFKSTGGQFNGQVYPTNAPIGYNGGFWYLRLAADF